MRISYKGFDIECSDEVYEPSDDTFLLADSLRIPESSKVLEIGTGTGIISISASKNAKSVLAVDINPKALSLAKKNVMLNGIKNVEVRRSDLFSRVEGAFDIIIFNSPYLPQSREETVRSQINSAWDGGSDGRKVIGRFLSGVKKHLSPGGAVYLLESSLSSYEKSLEFFRKEGFTAKVIAEKPLFFEKLVVIKAKLVR